MKNILALPLPTDEPIARHKPLGDGVYYATDKHSMGFYIVYGEAVNVLSDYAKDIAYPADIENCYYFSPPMVGILIRELEHMNCFLDYPDEQLSQLLKRSYKSYPDYFENQNLNIPE